MWKTVDVPAIEELSERFLKSINYYGLVGIGIQTGSQGW